MPARGAEAAEEGIFRGLLVDMKTLRIIACREADDVFFGKGVAADLSLLADGVKLGHSHRDTSGPIASSGRVRIMTEFSERQTSSPR